MKNLPRKTAIIGIITILLMVSSAPSQARITDYDTNQQNLSINDNILANITVTWDSFLHRYSLRDLAPNVTIAQTPVRDFYFPEINGTIPQMNFTVICKHKLISPVLIPRFTQVYLAISYNGTYILLNQSKNHRCQSLEWEYINLTLESKHGFIPLESNGQNLTLNVEVGAYFFIFGSIVELAPITIHPVPQ